MLITITLDNTYHFEFPFLSLTIQVQILLHYGNTRHLCFKVHSKLVILAPLLDFHAITFAIPTQTDYLPSICFGLNHHQVSNTVAEAYCCVVTLLYNIMHFMSNVKYLEIFYMFLWLLLFAHMLWVILATCSA
jgi:hypothetical protein